jgi:hypothetical protein
MSPDRIKRGDLFADILVDRRNPEGEIWHYILQRSGSPDILFWGNCPTREEAVELATRILDQYRAHAVNQASA